MTQDGLRACVPWITHMCGCGVALATMMAMAAPVAAHHSVAAQYDSNQSVALRGVITRVEWQNPHIFFYIDVTDGASLTTNWAVEFTGPNLLYRAGWRKDSVKAGDEVTIEGMHARNGSNQAYLRMITMSDGRRFGAQEGRGIVVPGFEGAPRTDGNQR